MAPRMPRPGWLLLPSSLLIWLGLGACGTAQPFSRGEPSTPTPTITPSGDDDTSSSGDDDVSSPGDDDTPTSPTPAPPSFANEVKVVLQPCTACHSSGAGGWTYDGGSGAYDAVLLQVNLEDPPNSDLLLKATGSVSHGGGTFFAVGSADYLTILSWIEAGAPNN